MADAPSRVEFVGRDLPLARLDAALRRADNGTRTTVLVAGTAGIGKTSLLRAATRDLSHGAGWGTCVEGGAAPGYWPWTQAFNRLASLIGATRAADLAGADRPLLAAIATDLGPAEASDDSPRDRLLLMDAAARWLCRLAAETTVVVVVDDLQWADESSLALLDYLSADPADERICLLGAFRDDEVSGPVAERLGAVTGRAEHLQLAGLDRQAAGALVEGAAGRPFPAETIDAIYSRAGGHPLFTRELALAATDTGRATQIPLAVRGALARRLGRLDHETQRVLRTAALAGNQVLPDVVAFATGLSAADVGRALEEATDAGVVTVRADRGFQFDHDLFRDVLAADLDTSARLAVHAALGDALEERHRRGAQVAAADVARHLTAALTLVGIERVVRWCLAAAAADRAALAFAEAAGHLRRLRAAAAETGVALADPALVDVLVVEAEMLARAGRPTDARGLLRTAAEAAGRSADPRRIAQVALGVAQLGARFAARRDDTVAELERALDAVAGRDDAFDARLRATLARELQHSVPEDRPRAGPLSEQALALGRRADPDTLLACLFARHDVLWTPGGAPERAELAREIITTSQRCADGEREADGHLLLANALLEQGSAAFEPALQACLERLEQLGQARHRYTIETRRACIALLRGDLAGAAELIDDAAALGEAIFEPDAGNVRMSQRLELVRATAEPSELRAFAADAVAHWTGAPVHAHAVAAGFEARAGDLDAAARHVATVVDLGTWRADRSYLWSVFVRELSAAAIALGDANLCRDLLDDLRPLGASCGVNGAVVGFAGCHAHVAGNLARSLGDIEEARRLLDQACDVYQRLGADLLTDARRDLDDITPPALGSSGAAMIRQGSVWHITFGVNSATLPHSKGLADLAVLLGRPGADVHVLDLAGGADRSATAGPMADRNALDAYRRRLRDIDQDAEDADAKHDDGRALALAEEREAILTELRSVTGLGGGTRQFANHPAERARKAVSARLRDAIRALEPALPDLAAHLNRTILTGTYCRYRGDAITWEIRQAE